MFARGQRVDPSRGKPIDRFLQRAAVFSLLAAAISVSYGYFRSAQVQATAETNSGGYKVGDLFDKRELLSTMTELSLVIWIDPRCGACQQSGRFYSRLAELPTVVHVTIAAPGPRAKLDSYLDEFRIGIGSRFTFENQNDARSLGRVPSLSLVGRDGIVRKRWRGLLTPEQEREVFSILAGERNDLLPFTVGRPHG